MVCRLRRGVLALCHWASYGCSNDVCVVRVSARAKKKSPEDFSPRRPLSQVDKTTGLPGAIDFNYCNHNALTRPLPVTYVWSPIMGSLGQWSRLLRGRFRRAVAYCIYSGPVSWVSRLALVGVNWQFPVLSLACNSSGRRLVSSGFGFLPVSPERGPRSLMAWSARNEKPPRGRLGNFRASYAPKNIFGLFCGLVKHHNIPASNSLPISAALAPASTIARSVASAGSLSLFHTRRPVAMFLALIWIAVRCVGGSS